MTNRETEWSALLKSANAGHMQDFHRFLAVITPVLRNLIRAKGHSLPADIHEDILQEVLIAIHSKRHTWNDSAPVLPWLYAIARYKVVDVFRKNGARVHVALDDWEETVGVDYEAGIASGMDINTLMERLDDKSATIVRAISIDGESAADVGERMNMSESAVRVSLHRAIKKLTNYVKGNTP